MRSGAESAYAGGGAGTGMRACRERVGGGRMWQMPNPCFLGSLRCRAFEWGGADVIIKND